MNSKQLVCNRQATILCASFIHTILFHRPILCDVYLRVVTNQERRLLISVNLSLIPRPLPHFQCTLDTADEAQESDPFADIEEDEDELEENEFILDVC